MLRDQNCRGFRSRVPGFELVGFVVWSLRPHMHMASPGRRTHDLLPLPSEVDSWSPVFLSEAPIFTLQTAQNCPQQPGRLRQARPACNTDCLATKDQASILRLIPGDKV